MGIQRKDRGYSTAYKIPEVEENEEQEVLVISIPNTIIHKGTVMIEFFNASFTVVAMKSPARLYYFAVEAEIFKIYASLIGNSEYILD
jgi:hypothetical protein